MQFDNALALIKEKRPIIEPRQQFIDTLKKYYKIILN